MRRPCRRPSRRRSSRASYVMVLALLTGASCLADTSLVMESDLKTGTDEISVNGSVLATIQHRTGERTLRASTVEARLFEMRRPLEDGAAYPVRITIAGSMAGHRVEESYQLLAPPSPIEVEGFGVPYEGDDPGRNADEHARLQAWLASVDLPPDTSAFEEIHRSRTGRELRVWYEIAGRRVDGALTFDDDQTPAASFDSGFHATSDGWKIHHARELFYHRKSLEGVDVLIDQRAAQGGGDGPATMYSYHCGCYGWAIGGDWVTLGDRYLYHAAVEWAHHRVGAGFFVGIEGRADFPWIGFADRERTGLLARRAAAYELTDAAGDSFAEIEIRLAADPPVVGLGPQSYVFRIADGKGGLVEVATAALTSGKLELEIAGPAEEWREGLDRLDALLAAMPTQVLRGDGIRDSYLGEIETLIDWVRLIDDPGEENLADVVSEIDAASAIRKVTAWIEPQRDRFAIEKSDYRPLPPVMKAISASRED